MFWDGYDRAVDYCLARSANGKQTKVFTPNAEMLTKATEDISLLRLLKRAELPLPDGIGVYLAARMFGLSPAERTNGIDFAERLMKSAVKSGMKIFLLGAKPGIAEIAASRLKIKHCGLSIAGSHHGYFQKMGDENDAVIRIINESGAEILFVCFGFPLQERWICDNLPALEKIKIAAGLGGSLDVWSDEVSRAPAIYQKTGTEWLYRIATSPSRIVRLPLSLRFARLCALSKISNFTK